MCERGGVEGGESERESVCVWERESAWANRERKVYVVRQEEILKKDKIKKLKEKDR